MRRIKWGSIENEVRRRRLPLRCIWTVQALKVRFKATKSPRIYLGDVRLARCVPVNRGRLKDKKAGCSVSSIYRAKRDLERLCIVHVTHTKGGTTVNPKGEKVRAATGYEPHPALYFELAEEIRERRQQQQVDQVDVGPPQLTPQQVMAAKARAIAEQLLRGRAAP